MFHSLRLAGTATLAVAVPVLAFGQPTGVATATHAIAQPSLQSPARATPTLLELLPAGRYLLTIHIPASQTPAGQALPSRDTVQVVDLTKRYGDAELTLRVSQPGPVQQTYSGGVAPQGAQIQLSSQLPGFQINLVGRAEGPAASGKAQMAPSGLSFLSGAPSGTFDLHPQP